MAGIGTRTATKAAQWLLDGVMMRRLPLWQRSILAVVLVMLFVAPPVAVAVAVAVFSIREDQPGLMILSAALVGITAAFWMGELRKYCRRKK